MNDLWIFAFDINGTLDFGGCGGAIPSKQVAEEVRRQGAWFGTASGMYPWMQLQQANNHGLRLDFALYKAHLRDQLIVGIYKVWKKHKVRLIMVDDNPGEPAAIAKKIGAKFILANEFLMNWKTHAAGYIRRLQTP